MTDWTKIAFIFPGQGSQEVGMGKDFYEQSAEARAVFDTADGIMGFALSRIMFEGEQVILDDTSRTQPAMYINSMAIFRTLQAMMPGAIPCCVAGHSLGELTALTVAGALDFEAGVRLVKARGELMRQAGEQSAGGMAAILGLGSDVVQGLCEEASQATGEAVVLANDNCIGQIVISGHLKALEYAVELAKELGAKRAIPLAVSTAPHSPLMRPAEEDFVKVVEQTSFSAPKLPVYANITAKPLGDVEAIQRELEGQLTSPVHWTNTIQNMIADGVESFVEIGSKDVLTGLVKRINKDVNRWNISTMASLEAFVEAHGG